jgi:sugar/nucleoside kinase (ribokinase family)
MPSALVIGDVMTDVVVKPKGPLALGADVRATIRMLPGGSGANAACWLAREGIETRFAGRVGAADRAREKLHFAEYGVDARLAADDMLPTGALVTLLQSDGERSFFTDRGANLDLSATDLPPELLDGVDLLVISGYSLFEAAPREAALSVFAEAMRLKIPIAVDPASHSFLAEVGRARFLEWTRGAHFLFPNDDEAATLAGLSEPEAQLQALTRSYPIVVLKRGAAGAIAADSSGGRWSERAPNVDVVDTSGAGDAFLGGFLSAWLKGEGLEKALQLGVELGSHAVTAFGARP